MPTTKRQCENWLDTYMEWTLPRSEAPESFIRWAGFYTLAAVLRRKVKIPKDILGSWECPPHLYVLFIGPAGGPRKTTTANYAVELLENLPDVVKGPTIVSQASLLDKLVDSEDASVYVISEEFSDLIMKSKGEMFEFLTSMFDGKKSIEASTISRGAQFAEKPCINLLAATTPTWVAENMSEAVIGGGFASRVIFVYEEGIRRKQLIYKGHIVPADLAVLKQKLVDDLIHIDLSIKGDFDITDAAQAWLDDPIKKTGWYQVRAPQPNQKMQGYHNREPAHLFKVAMLTHIARSDTLLLDVEDFELALSELKKIEINLPRVFEGIGKNPYTFDMKDIVSFVRDRKKVERAELFDHFKASAQPSMLNDLVDGLIVIKKLKPEIVDGKVIYIPGERA